MDKLRGIGSSIVDKAGSMYDKSGLGERISQLKENYLNKVYDIGYRRFIVKKLIAEGGFGFVFLVKETTSEKQYALKRIIVQDKERVAAIKNEVNLMKILAGQPNVVTLEDHKMTDNRTELEVLLLMEFCSCSLLDAMNQGRIKDEHEIYKVFSQNVLLGEDGTWKLCDFGSATTATYLPTTERERCVAEEDINRNTTMMYRAPEMVDLYRRQPINEKVDIWALGCILFKMAYMVDAFDGGLGILNARYTFPEFRRTTPSFEEFIAYLLNPDPTARPNIQQVQDRLATLRGVPASKQPTNPPQRSPTARHTPPNIAQLQNTNTRPASAPSQKPVADLVDWGDSTSTPASTPSPRSNNPSQHTQLHNSAPIPSQAKPAAPIPSQSKPAAALFDTLDWQYTSTSPSNNISNPKPPQPASPLKSVPQSAPSHQRTNSTSSPATKQPLKSNPSNDGPDLLDFSTPSPSVTKPTTTSAPMFSAPPAGYYSPQPPRPNYNLGGPTPPYYSPPYPSNQPNRPVQQDPLAQFVLPKKQSASNFDDFDPLAKKSQPVQSTQPPQHSPTSHTPSLLPMPQQGHRSKPPANSPASGDSLINF